MQLIHSKIGLAYQLYPNQQVEGADVIEMTNEKMEGEVNARKEVAGLANGLKEELLDQKTRDLIAS